MSLKSVRGFMNIRYAAELDTDWCISQDFSIKNSELMRRKIEQHEIIVAELNGVLAGYLRMEYLWSKIPYMSVVEVLTAYRKRGIGRALLIFLEKIVRGEGCQFLLSSAESTEPEAQTWHRKMGFAECGIVSGLNPDGADELFFRKEL